MRHHPTLARGTVVVLVALTGLLLAPLGATAADRPFGVIDSQRIVAEYDAARDAQEQYQKFLQDLEKEVADRERELQRMAEEIESQKLLLGEEALRARLQDFEKQRGSYFQFREQVEERAEQEYKAKIDPIIRQVKTIAERIGKEEGYGIVIDSAALTVLYLDPDVDLTNQVLSALARGAED
ncbi:MAG: OmpH family outer membrane protein [Candidatus Krumholzibacteriia bacterium]